MSFMYFFRDALFHSVCQAIKTSRIRQYLKNPLQGVSEFGCTKICLRAGILQNCDSLLIKSHLQMHSYYTVDVFKPKNDHPGSKQVSVRAALRLVSSGSCSLTHPGSGGEAAQGDTGTHHLGRDGIY